MAVEYVYHQGEMRRKEAAAVMFIRICSYEGRLACGILRFMVMEKQFPFQGLDQMLLLIEEILDQEGFLISMHEYRRIDVRVSEDHWLEIQGEAASEEGITVISEITEIAREERRSMVQKIYQSGKHFSPQNFLIKIYGRQNQSLQGEMRIDETKVYFRSGMELVRLMHQWLKVNMERHKTEKTEDGKV